MSATAAEEEECKAKNENPNSLSHHQMKSGSVATMAAVVGDVEVTCMDQPN